MRVVIIGGGSAGTTCAFELRKLNKKIEIVIIEKANHYEYSPCALPYLINDEISDFDKIFIYQKEDYENNNIDVLLNSEVYNIVDNKVLYKVSGVEKELPYDKLILATGAKAVVPKIDGLSEVDFYQLKTVADFKKIKAGIQKGSKSVVIGAGMIGVELASVLSQQEEQVTLLEQEKNILPNMLDKDMAVILQDFLTDIKIIENAKISKIVKNEIVMSDGKVNFDKLFVCTGSMPNLDLAKKMTLKTNEGIVVDEFFQTSFDNVYAIGDCIEQKEFNSGKTVVSQLGSLAVLQARFLAANILGNKQVWEPIVNNTVSKLGDVYVGSVGLSETRALALGEKIISVKHSDFLRSKYYSEKEKISVKLITDYEGVILGGQIIAHGEVAGQLNLLAMAIKQKNTVKELSNLENCYNPAVISVLSPLTVASIVAEKKVTFLKNN